MTRFPRLRGESRMILKPGHGPDLTGAEFALCAVLVWDRISPMNRECVILLHGIFRGKLDMLPLALYLRAQGYDVLNISYPARRGNLKNLAAFLDGAIRERIPAGQTVHFVTHSLGGLLARSYIDRYGPSGLGAVVMLGPPNTGSEWADFMAGKKGLKTLYRFFFGPVGVELLTTHVHEGAHAAYDLGVIAGRRSSVPFANRILAGEHDGMVRVERTRLAGMTAHLVMDTTHTYMIWSPAVMRQIRTFLIERKFQDS